MAPGRWGNLAGLTGFAAQLAMRGVLWPLIVRPGLLAGVVGLAVRHWLGLGLMTTHLDAWYADSALAGIVLTLALTAWGLYGSLSVRRLRSSEAPAVSPT